MTITAQAQATTGNPPAGAPALVQRLHHGLESVLDQTAGYLSSLGTAASLTLAGAGLDQMPTGAIPSAVFGSVAFPFSNLPAAARWRKANAPRDQFAKAQCGGDRACKERSRSLAATIESARGAGFMEKLRRVNTAVNTMIRYSSDQAIYGRMDYWAPASQTLRAGVGDCEDYAILKLAALKAAGVPASSMSMAVIRDRKRNLFHAVLVVTTNKGHFVLDNLSSAVLPDTRLAHYQPLYSMSQDRYWIHGVRRSEGQVASRMPAFDAVMPGLGPDDGSGEALAAIAD